MTSTDHADTTHDTSDNDRLGQFQRPLLEKHRAHLEELQKTLGHEFQDPSFLLEAIVHPSKRDSTGMSYERLEFLGDAVLGLVVADWLFRRFPKSDEGELTRLKSAVVSRTALASVGRRLDITEQILLGRGMKGQGAPPRSVTANSTEAILGALFCDGGLEVARRFIENNFAERLERAMQGKRSKNHKSLLQQFTQSKALGTPTYRVMEVSGPDHERTFSVCAIVGGREFEPSTGMNKKMAEQRAARSALRILESEEHGEGNTDT